MEGPAICWKNTPCFDKKLLLLILYQRLQYLRLGFRLFPGSICWNVNEVHSSVNKKLLTHKTKQLAPQKRRLWNFANKLILFCPCSLWVSLSSNMCICLLISHSTWIKLLVVFLLKVSFWCVVVSMRASSLCQWLPCVLGYEISFN